MNNGFIETVNISKEEKEAITRISLSPDFFMLRLAAERLLQANAYDLLARTGEDRDEIYGYADDYRGGFHFWKQLTSLIKKINDATIN